jgi:hypothetical protein
LGDKPIVRLKKVEIKDIWDHKDPGQQQSWVPQATWEFFEKF